MTTPTPPESESWRDSPSAWFAALESALRRDDFDAAAQARAELERLGIRLSLRLSLPNRPNAKGGAG